MLSGVGPADQLAQHRIPLVADLPGVGQHLQDHLVLDLHYKDKDKLSLSYLLDQGFFARLRVISNIWQFRMSGTGPLTTNVRISYPSHPVNDCLTLSDYSWRRPLGLCDPQIRHSSLQKSILRSRFRGI